MNSEPSQQSSFRVRWQGQIEAVQCRAWVWRYKTDNRTHHHLGFNLFVEGEADGRDLLLRPPVMPVIRHGPTQTGAVFRYLPVD